jgi:phospholipid/cholesterol/gamma-HCH transport system substrate-binding protein
MSQQSKVGWAKLRVGLVTIVALAILGYLIFLLSGTHGFFKGKSTIYTYLGDSSDLAQGAPVRLNGIVVGEVSKVELSGSSEPARVIRIDMEIKNEYMSAIPVDSGAKLASGNLLGTKYVNINKGRSTQTIKQGAELKSSSSAALEDVFQQGDTALAALEAILQKVNTLLDQIMSGQGSIGKLLVDPALYDKAVGVVNEGHKLLATLNSDQGTLGKLIHDDKLYDDFRGSVSRLNTLMDGLQQGQGTMGKILKDPALYDNSLKTVDDLRKTIAEAKTTLADINAGKGTVGKLLKSDELHDQIKATIGRMDTLLDKINSGQGTIGQLLVNPALYDSLEGTTRELHGLLKDFRANPKKFLRIKLGLF